MSVLRFQGPVLPYGDVRDVYVVDGVVSHEPHPGVSVTASGWIVPGLVDAHCHVGLNDLGAAPEEETLEQAVANRDAGALLIRDAGSALDTSWMHEREDLPRLIRCGRHLARYGDSGYMLLLQTDDFAREKTRWASLGVRTIWDTALDNITAAHLHPKDVGGAIVSVDEPRPAASWRWGGPDWQTPPTHTGPQRVRGITLRTPDATALAQRWALVFDLAAPIATSQGWRLALEDGFSMS